MAETAAPKMMSSLHSSSEVLSNTTSVQFAAASVKRKTPSELRVEQFKRMRIVADEALKSSITSEKLNGPTTLGVKKVDMLKPPRYIDTRVADVYPITKPGDRLKSLCSRDKFKDSAIFQNQIKEMDQNPMLSSFPNAKIAPKFQWKNNENKSSHDLHVSKDNACNSENVEHKVTSQSYDKFRDVAELSSSSTTLSATTTVDMEKVLKGMANTRVSSLANSINNHGGQLNNLGSSISINILGHELQIPGDKIPLDLSLKISMRMVSSSPLNWCHKLSLTSRYMGMKEFIFPFDSWQRKGCAEYEPCSNTLQQPEVSFWKALHSWVHPESVLPTPVISAMALAAARGGAAENNFVSKRQSAWEDSFRSIYYMFRNQMCNLFYLCTQQFVVMFMGGGLIGKKDNTCSAYLTRSTRGLRALLKEHDVGFSMPLCHTEVEQASAEDLHELSEFEKSNPGQTRLVDSMADVDNSSQSLLSFVGNKNVHGLYDFLLNHRFFLSSVACTDVPLLYAPVPFQNASLYVPEISCKQMRRADDIQKPFVGLTSEASDSAVYSTAEASANISYVLEIKEAILPPWVVSGICAAISADRKAFETSFVTDPLSDGLNVVLDAQCQTIPAENVTPKVVNSTVGFMDAILNPSLRSAVVKHLKYLNGSYVATLSAI